MSWLLLGIDDLGMQLEQPYTVMALKQFCEDVQVSLSIQHVLKYPNTNQIPPKHTWRAYVFRTLDDPGSGTPARWVNVAATATGEFFYFRMGNWTDVVFLKQCSRQSCVT